MSDNELLELAAKACGYEYVSNSYWNPLTDAGDAFRLIVSLELKVNFRTLNVDVSRGDISASEYMPTWGDAAATRRAIVRVAAEIGRGVTAQPGERT